MKLKTMAVFGIGYVLGSKAGRERYEQIMAAAHLAAKRLRTYSTDHDSGPDDAEDATI